MHALESSIEAHGREGLVRVVAGVALTLATWVTVPFIGSLAIAVSPPFLLAVAVALAARAMQWTPADPGGL